MAILRFLAKWLQWDAVPSLDRIPDDIYPIPSSVPSPAAPLATTTPPITNPTETTPSEANIAPETLLWDTPKRAWRSVRTICDEMGLPLQKTVLVNGVKYYPKDIVCSCVWQESEFSNEAVGKNRDENGLILSTDWYLVQVNDTPGWHIGKGLRFSSIEDVHDNPERAIRWMVSVYKNTGKLQPWSSYTSGAYKKHLSPQSKMWQLAVI